MKRFRTNIIICLVMLFSATIFSSISFAGSCGNMENPNEGNPPFGLAIQSEAAGAKLFGTLMIEYGEFKIVAKTECSSGYKFSGNLIRLRLSKGNDLTSFYATADLCSSSGQQQTTITALMRPQILCRFFNVCCDSNVPCDSSLNIALISIDSIAQSGMYDIPTYFMADVTLTVK